MFQSWCDIFVKKSWDVVILWEEFSFEMILFLPVAHKCVDLLVVVAYI